MSRLLIIYKSSGPMIVYNIRPHLLRTALALFICESVIGVSFSVYLIVCNWHDHDGEDTGRCRLSLS